MSVERKINVLGLINVGCPVKVGRIEDLDWFRFQSPKDNIDWYVPERQVEILSADSIVYRVRGGAFLPRNWDYTWTLEKDKIDVSGPRRWGLQVCYIWRDSNVQHPNLLSSVTRLLRRFTPRNDKVGVAG